MPHLGHVAIALIYLAMQVANYFQALDLPSEHGQIDVLREELPTFQRFISDGPCRASA